MKKLILDTNIFIRFLIKDISSQYEEAKRIFKRIEEGKEKGLISILVINEIIWVLEGYYELERELYISQLLKLLALKNMKILEAKKDTIIQTLQLMSKNNIDFTDIYLFLTAKKNSIVSFDKDLKKILI